MGSLRIVTSAVAVAAVLAGAGAAGAQSPTLFGTVGPGASIRLTDASGNRVNHLDPGTYTIQVKDESPEHNFHLGGPGVDQATDVETTGTVTWTVTLSDGAYRYQCDVHPTTMVGNFFVGTAKPPPSPPTIAPVAPAVKLSGSVGPGKRIGLTRAGAKVLTLEAGAALLTVSDRSATDNFRLTGPGVNKATSKAGKGTTAWKVALTKGIYRYRSDATASLKGSFRVT
jgi:plastocyanin